MKILIALRHSGYLRLFESAISGLAARGHEVTIGFTSVEKAEKAIDARSEDFVGAVHFRDDLLPTRADKWMPMLQAVRACRDYCHYLNIEFDAAALLRDRARSFAPKDFVRLMSERGWLRRPVESGLRLVSDLVPTSSEIDRLLERERPDILLLTFYVDFGSDQIDYVRSARRLGIPVAYSVASWDNLTNKGALKDLPDLLLVWNEHQRREAELLHGMPADRIAVTGAQTFDHWFTMSPGVPRERFLERAGIPAGARYLVFLGSSPFIASHAFEVAYLRSFVNHLRNHPDPRLRDLWVLVRPHYQASRSWKDFDMGSIGPKAVLFPKEAENPYSADQKQEYYDTLHHSVAALGINTSAMIEAAIVGKPVLSVVSAPSQDQTIHFRYLLNGGFLCAERDTERVVDRLIAVLDGDTSHVERDREFVRSFVRPRGLEEPAVSHYVNALERLPIRGCLPGPSGLASLLARPFMRFARSFGGKVHRQILADRLEVKNPPAWRKVGDRFHGPRHRIVLGLTAYNGERFIREALDSVLQQSHRDFILVAVDDESTDKTGEILAEYAAKDPRIVHHRNPSRLGMVGTWCEVFRIARAVAPDMRYFAWISDHDRWAPEWLKTLVAALDADPGLVLAYPTVRSIDEKGRVLNKPKVPSKFDTVDSHDLPVRFRRTCWRMVGVGDMVYGLFRADALAACGVYRRVLLPDRLLMMELALHGRFFQASEILWYRRRISQSSIARQRRTLFGKGRPPLYAYLPWWVQQFGAFAGRYVLRGEGAATIGLGQRVAFSLEVLRSQAHKSYSKMRTELRRRREESEGRQPRGAVLKELWAGWREAWLLRTRARKAPQAFGLPRPPGGPTRVLFIGRRTAHFVYYRSILTSLLARGAEVDFLLDREWSARDPASPTLNEILRHDPNLRAGWAKRRLGLLREFIFPLRELRTYVKYTQRTGQSAFYRDRWFKLLEPKHQTRMRQPVWDWVGRHLPLDRAIAAIEAVVPPDPAIVRHILEHKPDVILASPANMRFTEEIEYVKAARFLGIPTTVMVLSWDNLSTKGLITVRPDHLFAWNQAQFRQAIEIHRIPGRDITVAGAPFFDQWNEAGHELLPREEFCVQPGLDPARPYILYLGSSKNIATDESWFVEQLHQHLANSPDPRLRQMQILLRPHPANTDVYRRLALPGLAVWPADGKLPETGDDMTDFHNSLGHASLVLGINTSAMIDAMLADRPCATVLLDKYSKTQVEAEHFQAMAEHDALYVLKSLDELGDLLGRLGAGHDEKQPKRQAFATNFAWPRGRDRLAGDIVAEKTLQLAAQRKPAMNEHATTAGARALADLPATGIGGEYARMIQTLRAQAPYQNYLRARDAIVGMLEDEAKVLPGVSAYWREELAGFDYMFDASPLIINRLREHCYHITGIKSYEYRAHHTHKAQPFFDKLAMLRAEDPVGLWVPEAPTVGGFGFDNGDGLINIDTLKFYEVLIAMGKVQLIQQLRAKDRAMVLEIGTGWGGFAYQFKKAVPNTTYVLVDLPQTMLFSATYLQTMYPSARFLFVRDESMFGELERALEYDFVFIGHHRFDLLQRLPLDLAVNMVSFQEMPADTVDGYVGRLAAFGCPRIFSLNRDRSPHNPEMTSVSDILAKHFALEQIDMLPLQYTQLGPRPAQPKPLGIYDYRHQIGRLAA